MMNISTAQLGYKVNKTREAEIPFFKIICDVSFKFC